MSEIATIQNHAPAHTGLGSLRDQMQFAQALSESDIIPAHFKGKPANCMIAMGVSESLGVSTFNLMQEMSVISGRPAYTAKFMAALTRRAGHKLRQSFDKATGTARVVIVRKDDPDFEHVIEWDEKKARAHGYWGKGHWQKNSELMLKNRALSECVREACPEVLGGISYTKDEIQDFDPETEEPRQAPQTRRPARAVHPDDEDPYARLIKGLTLIGCPSEEDQTLYVKSWAEQEGIQDEVKGVRSLSYADASKFRAHLMEVFEGQKKRKAEQERLQAVSDSISDEDAMVIEVDEEGDTE